MEYLTQTSAVKFLGPRMSFRPQLMTSYPSGKQGHGMQSPPIINPVCSLVVQVLTGTIERASFGDPVLSGPGQTSNMPRLQNPLQDLYRGDSGLKHQTPYSVPQLL